MVHVGYITFLLLLVNCAKKSQSKKGSGVSDSQTASSSKDDKEKTVFTMEEDGFEFWTDDEEESENDSLSTIQEESENTEKE